MISGLVSRERPVVFLCVFWIGGIVLGHYLGLSLTTGAAGCALALGLYGAKRLRAKLRPRLWAPPGAGWLWVGLGCLGIARAALLAREDARALELAQWAQNQWMIEAEGFLAEEPVESPSGIRLVLEPGCWVASKDRRERLPLAIEIHAPPQRSKFTSAPASRAKARDKRSEMEKALASAAEAEAEAKARAFLAAYRGDRIRAIGAFRAPGAARNPGAMSLEETAQAHGMGGSLRPASLGDIWIEPPAKGRSYWAKFNRVMIKWRRAATERLMRAGGSENGPALCAVILGDTQGLSPRLYQQFQTTGLLHLFSVSGLHAGIIAAALLVLLTPSGLSQRWQHAAIVAGVFVYAALTGFSIPVLRTAIMTAALGIQNWMRRPTDTLSRLGLAAFAICAAWPRSVFQIGFQLSFLAMFTLIAFDPFLKEWIRFSDPDRGGWRGGWISRAEGLIRGLAHMVILQAALGPILAHYFHQVSLVAPLANMLAIPPASAALVAGAAYIGPGILIPGLGELLGFVADKFMMIALFFTELCASIPRASISVRPQPPWAITLYYLLLFGGSYLEMGRGALSLAKQRAALCIHALALCALIVWLPWFDGDSRERLRITFLDVGQGDSVLLAPPGGGAILIDAGPAWPQGLARNTLEPALRFQGLEEIDLAVATHADADHIGGYPELIETFPIRSIGEPEAMNAEAGRGLENGERLANLDRLIAVDIEGNSQSDSAKSPAAKSGPGNSGAANPAAKLSSSSVETFLTSSSLLAIRPVERKSQAAQSLLAERLENLILRKGIRKITLCAGMKFQARPSGLTLEVIHPPCGDSPANSWRSAKPHSEEGRNENSVVLRVTWREFSMLLTGDANISAEEIMLRRPDAAQALRANVLKAGHHGSETSTCPAFLAAVHPQTVVFSCGRNNRYGHPSQEVVDRCAAMGAMIHRTDRQGALVLETDGRRLWTIPWRAEP